MLIHRNNKSKIVIESRVCQTMKRKIFKEKDVYQLHLRSQKVCVGASTPEVIPKGESICVHEFGIVCTS
jgi:hypothetical protein